MNFKEEYDAVVVGAGPAGSVFAKVAAEGGMSVLLIDKKKSIGSPVRCGEGIGEGKWKWGKHSNFRVPEKAVAAHIGGALLVAPNGNSITVRNEGTKGFVLERKIFDKFLAAEAARAGAHVRANTGAKNLLIKGGKICGVRLEYFGEEFEVRSDLVVSAEGMEARIAREAGFGLPSFSLYDVDTCFEYEMVNVEVSDLIEIYLGSCAPRGYVWVFPKGRDCANVGIGVGGHLGLNPKKLLDKFIDSSPRFKKAEVLEEKGGVISVGECLKELVKDNFMVIGTAAHQVDPIHGGGIALAMKAGAIAGDTAIEAWRKKDFSKKSLSPYTEQWNSTEAKRLDKKLVLRKVIEQLNDSDYNAIIEALDEKELDKVLKGEYKSAVARVLLKRPQLLKVLGVLITN